MKLFFHLSVCLLAIASVAISSARAAPSSLETLNVVLVVVDTLGANQLKVFNGKDTATPNLDAFAAQSVVFERAYSTAPWTKPAVASIFTGQLPSVHKVRRISDIVAPNVPMLAERLQSLGFATAGIVSHTLLAPKTGYSKGFDFYEMVKFRGHVHDSVTSDQVTDAGVGWLASRAHTGNKQPFFLFLHYFDPHYNYMHHAEFDRSSWYRGALTSGMNFKDFRRAAPRASKEDIRFMENLHQEEISFTDKHIGRLLNYLEEKNVADNTIVILTADHGEEFMEHGGIGHGRTLFDEVVRVPLAVRLPGTFKPQRINAAVSTMDITPTLLALSSRTQDTAGLQGESFLPTLLGQGAPRDDRLLFMEVDYNASWIGAVKGNMKIALNKRRRAWKLFDVVADPAERNDVFGLPHPQKDSLVAAIEEFRRTHKDPEPRKFDPEQESKGLDKESIEQLKSLGYL